MTLDTNNFKAHLTGLVEQSADPVSFPTVSSISDQAPRFIIAYSGGLDSHVLLHLMHSAQLNCLAVYIDHGLQAVSKTWAHHCAASCQQLAIEFQSIRVNATAETGESPEASARTARYQALAEVMQPGDMLLTAQHLQDQAETLLLQMLRTAGPAGLAAMPALKRFAAGWHLRPLLNVTRTELQNYAREHQLQWIDDPSNTDQRFDRNFFRQSIFPLLKQRWPSINKTLSNVSLLQAEASELMNDLAALDAQSMISGDTLDIKQLVNLTPARQRNCLRYWLLQLGLDVPTAKRLHEILGPMLSAAEDKSPMVSWSQTEVRRFQGKLYAMRMLSDHDAHQHLAWDGRQAITIESVQQRVLLQSAEAGLSPDILQKTLTIRFRHGGEKIKPAGRAHTMELKKLMQEASIPPWLRSRIPLLYLEDSLIAVADYWLAEEYQNGSDQPGLQFISCTN